jgi:hypothetical protein
MKMKVYIYVTVLFFVQASFAHNNAAGKSSKRSNVTSCNNILVKVNEGFNALGQSSTDR